jgi:hypothetical protein
LSKGAPESDFHWTPVASGGSDNISARFYNDSSMTRALTDYSASAHPAAADFPMLNDTIRSQIASAGEVNFSTPDQNKDNPPDYRLTVGDDGQVHLEKVGDGDPNADGKLNIEIDPKNKSLQEAIKQADKNLKEYVREMMTLWQQQNPGKPHPGWWDDVLNSQPNIPQDAAPVPIESPKPRTQPQPQPQESAPAPQQSEAPASRGGGGGGGGGGSGGGFAGTRGFDNQGYYNPKGGGSDGTVWTGGADAKGAPIGPGEQAKAKDIYDYFVEKGFTPAQASGILGNIQTESSFKTNAYNAGEGAIGICQWEGGRRTALESFAAQQNKPVTDLHVQLDFIMHEFQTSERGAFAAVKAAQTPEAAAQAFQSKYERSASLGDRAANARNIYATIATDKGSNNA